MGAVDGRHPVLQLGEKAGAVDLLSRGLSP